MNYYRKKMILKRIKITGICFSVIAALTTEYVLLKKHSDNYIRATYYDEFGTPKKVDCQDNGFRTPFEKCYEYVFEGEEPIRKYKSKYLYFLINKETYEVEELVILQGRDFNNQTIGEHFYDFNSEKLLTFEKDRPDLFDDKYFNQIYYDYLKNNYYWLPLVEATKYGIPVKELLTKDEIIGIEEDYINRFYLVEEAKRSGK